MYNELQITALVERGCKVFYPGAYNRSLIKSVGGYGGFFHILSDIFMIIYNSHNHFLN